MALPTEPHFLEIYARIPFHLPYNVFIKHSTISCLLHVYKMISIDDVMRYYGNVTSCGLYRCKQFNLKIRFIQRSNCRSTYNASQIQNAQRIPHCTQLTTLIFNYPQRLANDPKNSFKQHSIVIRRRPIRVPTLITGI